MNYEVVELEQKIVVGKSIVTSNSDPKMTEQIGKLWCKLYDAQNGYYKTIKNKVREECAIGMYSDYEGDTYTVTVGAVVTKSENPELIEKRIVKGKYAKFSLHGNMVMATSNAWGEIWNTKLNRTYTGDFEEYLPCDHCAIKDTCNPEKCDDCYINIYVAIQ